MLHLLMFLSPIFNMLRRITGRDFQLAINNLAGEYNASAHPKTPWLVTVGEASARARISMLVPLMGHEMDHNWRANYLLAPIYLGNQRAGDVQFIVGHTLESQRSFLLFSHAKRITERLADKTAGRVAARARFKPTEYNAWLKAYNLPLRSYHYNKDNLSDPSAPGNTLSWNPQLGYDPTHLRIRSTMQSYRGERNAMQK